MRLERVAAENHTLGGLERSSSVISACDAANALTALSPQGRMGRAGGSTQSDVRVRSGKGCSANVNVLV